jgi:hypothetical protein
MATHQMVARQIQQTVVLNSRQGLVRQLCTILLANLLIAFLLRRTLQFRGASTRMILLVAMKLRAIARTLAVLKVIIVMVQLSTVVKSTRHAALPLLASSALLI